MANTFKVKTHTAMPDTAGTILTLYTCPGSTTAVVIGLRLTNLDGSTRTASVQLVSDTSDTETNETVTLLKDAPIPAGSSIEVLGGAKIVLQATDVLKIDCDTADKIDAVLSIMEID